MEQDKNTVKIELKEDQLDNVSGGATENRHDPKVCPNLTRTRYECVGFLQATPCDHLKRTKVKDMSGDYATYDRTNVYRIVCAMGSFDYIGYGTGDTPVPQGAIPGLNLNL